ncbi:hypothetical protein CLPU_9c00830 [Gottschalkia purinilytica]|uniref:Uncharacterized protein n=1 Tax=Gottschalkia purinilytica TaxID=1503 RepID=A0A0L0W9R1_GOTPU|nr:hypothetical protein [Gottschalkia purinilytica]KNF08187.1 hypothetical protein CLPU_9c00830 [Gottschalkia purinilytica]
MDKWKYIDIKGVTTINKLVGEFEIWALNKIPYEKFKIRFWETKRANMKEFLILE